MAEKTITTSTYTVKGTKASTQVALPAALFGAPVNQDLVSLAVRVYLNNQRHSNAKAKRRGDVVASTKKVWRQKGTGRARHGAVSAPIFVGGGVAHGPIGNQNYNLRLTRKMRRSALKSALTIRAQENQVVVVKDLEKLDQKTKSARTLLEKVTPKDAKKVLLVLAQPYESVQSAVANLKHVSCTQASRLNVYEILNHQTIIIDEKALAVLSRNGETEVNSAKKTESKKSDTK